MLRKPPLHLHLLSHPRSASANSIAAALMRRFVEPPASGGLRIPVRFTPERDDDLPPALGDADGIQWDAAAHTIVVVLGDERMVRVAGGGTGKEWTQFVQSAMDAAPVGRSPHHVVPVALDAAAFSLGGDRHVLRAIPAPELDAAAAEAARLSEVSLHVAARAIQLLDDGLVSEERPDQLKAPVRIFISHAKADLDAAGKDPARQTMAALEELPIEKWFDAAKIGTSQRFDEAIEAGIRDSTVMIAFHTDHYGSRSWCRREVLAAKEKGIHLLVVDALRDSEVRLFPYMGNVPSVRWQFDDPAADARRVIDRAVLEALKSKHYRAVLEGTKADGDIVLGGPPEATTLAFRGADAAISRTYLYPDPPLTREELDLLHRLAPNAHAVTPLTRLAQWKLPDGIEQVAVSISESDDIRRYGLSDAHQQTLSDEVHLYLLLAGLTIGYGGSLKGNLDDPNNFTLRLFELVRGYAKLAEQVERGNLHPIVNYIPWPLVLDYGDKEWALFGQEAIDAQCERPDLGKQDDEIFPAGASGWRLAARTPEQRYAWARGLTLMRRKMTESTQARIVIGGKLKGFLGLVPGVIEEAWMSLNEGKPLFVVGAFGGCGRAIADQLTGAVRPELTTDHARRTVPDYEAAVQLYGNAGAAFVGLEQMGAAIAHAGARGLAHSLRNGLEDDENLELIRCFDATRIAELILQGLAKL